MDKKFAARVAFLALSPLLGLNASDVFADSNASGGTIENSETVYIGAGPYAHAAGEGSQDNSIAMVSFTGGFNANQIRFSGTLTAEAAGTYASEAQILVHHPDPFSFETFTWGNNGPTGFSTYEYNAAQQFGDSFGGSVGAGGFWRIEFIESYDDAAGADSYSSDVYMTLEEATPVSDSEGNFSFGVLSDGTTTSEGEFVLSNLYDSYTFTLESDGIFSANTEFKDVFTGSSMDTELALFDSVGNLLASNDDIGGGILYSQLVDLDLTAGDYTLVVAGYNTVFSDGFGVTAGAATGDYGLNMSFISAVPEPGTVSVLGVAAIGMAFVRRRR